MLLLGQLLILCVIHFFLFYTFSCRMANFNTGSLNPVLSVFLLFNQNTIHLGCTPWQHSVVFTASICLHSWSLRACAEPRRASARRDNAPLVLAVKARNYEITMRPPSLSHLYKDREWQQLQSGIIWYVRAYKDYSSFRHTGSPSRGHDKCPWRDTAKKAINRHTTRNSRR